MREIGRIERTIHTLDRIEDKGLRADTTDVLNKGEARHTLARAPILEPSESRWDDQGIHRSALISTTTSAARAMKATATPMTSIHMDLW
jgi:TnpA family transposase